ncbi:MAG: hypothetical protein ACOVMF_03050 [Aquiluna sp.]
MVHQINPALARLWIADNARQYGYKKALTVSELSEPQQRLLDYFELGLTSSQHSNLPRLAKASQETVSDLESRLQSVLWQSPTGISRSDVESRFAEIARVLLQGLDPEEVKKLRKSKSVFIEKLDATGLTIAKALALAGVGKQLSLDQIRVSSQDVSQLGYLAAQLGLPRVRAAQALIGSDLQMHSRISGSFDAVSLAVLITTDIVNPASYQIWQARDIPHLSIVFDEEGVEVSPLIEPGKTSCLACYEKHRIETEPNWPVIAPQLLALDRTLADSALLLFASGVAVNQMLNFIDHGQSESNAVRLNRDGKIASFMPPAISCGCR